MFQITFVRDNWLNISSTKRGIIWILLSGICFAFLETSIKMASREIPDIWTWFGGCIIIISTFYISRRDVIKFGAVD